MTQKYESVLSDAELSKALLDSGVVDDVCAYDLHIAKVAASAALAKLQPQLDAIGAGGVSGQRVTQGASDSIAESDLGSIRVGRLPTMNQDEYPGLGAWWVQLRVGSEFDEVLARVYGETPEQAHARAVALSDQAQKAERAGPVVKDSLIADHIPDASNMMDKDADKADADRYRLLRRGQHWSVINGIGDALRADELDAAIDAVREGPTK